MCDIWSQSCLVVKNFGDSVQTPPGELKLEVFRANILLKTPFLSSKRGRRPTYESRRYSAVRKHESRLMFGDWWCFLWYGSKRRIHWKSIAGKDTSSLSGKVNPYMEIDSHVLMIKVRKGSISLQESLSWQHLHLHILKVQLQTYRYFTFR